MEKIILSSKVQILLPQFATHQFPANFPESKSQIISRSSTPSLFHNGIHGKSQIPGHLLKVHGARRRRSNMETETYVLMEPGKNEEFLTEDELRERLKIWLQNWPAKTLPPDLARFDAIDDAVQWLVKSVCELEIDGDFGSLQCLDYSKKGKFSTFRCKA